MFFLLFTLNKSTTQYCKHNRFTQTT